jgi:hypothetical protein
MKEVRLRDGLLMAVGVILVGTCRPFEGALLCLPVAFILGRWIFFGVNRPTLIVLIRRSVVPLVLIVAAGAWMGYYNCRVFGSPLTLPYTVDRSEYAMAPYFIWQPQRPQPVYRHKVIQEFYSSVELDPFKRGQSAPGFLLLTLRKVWEKIMFFAGFSLLIPLIMLRRVLLDRRIRFLLLCLLVLMAGQLVEVFLIPHYAAPFTAAFYAIGLQAVRHLRLWNPGDQPVGMTLTRLTVTLCILLAGLRLYAEPLHLDLPVWPAPTSLAGWSGPGSRSGIARAQMEARLEQMPGRQLVIVRYAPDHNPIIEWVYNAAEIDKSSVIWAREMNETENLELINYYKDRTVWLVQPDTDPVQISVYPSQLNAGK